MVYKMHITQQHIDNGFAIGACSAQGSRFKLLLFQQCSDGDWGQLAQASAVIWPLNHFLFQPSFTTHLCTIQDNVSAWYLHRCHANTAKPLISRQAAVLQS